MKLCEKCLDFILDSGYIRTKFSAEDKPLQKSTELECEFWAHKEYLDFVNAFT